MLSRLRSWAALSRCALSLVCCLASLRSLSTSVISSSTEYSSPRCGLFEDGRRDPGPGRRGVVGFEVDVEVCARIVEPVMEPAMHTSAAARPHSGLRAESLHTVVHRTRSRPSLADLSLPARLAGRHAVLTLLQLPEIPRGDHIRGRAGRRPSCTGRRAGRGHRCVLVARSRARSARGAGVVVVDHSGTGGRRRCKLTTSLEGTREKRIWTGGSSNDQSRCSWRQE